jgi:hypothetical protein
MISRYFGSRDAPFSETSRPEVGGKSHLQAGSELRPGVSMSENSGAGPSRTRAVGTLGNSTIHTCGKKIEGAYPEVLVSLHKRHRNNRTIFMKKIELLEDAIDIT